MDNASIHKPEAIQSLFTSPGSPVTQIFLPPYSPQLNPIEHLYAEWKAKVRWAAPKIEHELSSTIHSASESIN